ncbi:glycosyltransferase family 2 protein, partial [Patescibacteria group bacterium]|nr:glycosyltransferase family 2 protein [Patescibacteria group bacterium]
MKLIIQIPCYNEEKTLPLVIKNIPQKIKGVDKIETQIIDDGSTDQTVAVAQKLGVNHIISLPFNRGLGNAFKIGIQNALKNKADILVNTDGDNQYSSKDITKLVEPIINKQAQIVIGNRQTDQINHFSLTKKILQRIGSNTVAYLAGVQIPDAVSGFRAYSRDALLELNITSEFSYVLDTIIQAAKKRIKITSVDIKTNPPTRKSRLFNNIYEHVIKSTQNLIRVYVFYEPLKTFSFIGGFFCLVGLVPMIRFLI